MNVPTAQLDATNTPTSRSFTTTRKFAYNDKRIGRTAAQSPDDTNARAARDAAEQRRPRTRNLVYPVQIIRYRDSLPSPGGREVSVRIPCATGHPSETKR